MTWGDGLPGQNKSFSDTAPDAAEFMHSRGWPPLTGKTKAVRMHGEMVRKNKYVMMIHSGQLTNIVSNYMAGKTEAQWWIDHKNFTVNDFMRMKS